MSRYIKRSTWFAAMLLGWLMLVLPVQAASFDCAKAKTKVEKLICADAELSKLDEEMAGLYGEILKASSNDPVLKQAQRDWLKYRQACFAPVYKQREHFCLSDRYRRHINILRGSLPTEPDAEKNISQLCVHIAVLVEKDDTSKLEPEAGIDPPTGSDYRNLDIDGDGIADSVKTGCGTGECLLQVKLSSGAEYDLDELKFYLIRYQSSIYALVGYSEDEESKDPKVYGKSHLVRLYHITPTGAKLMCGN